MGDRPVVSLQRADEGAQRPSRAVPVLLLVGWFVIVVIRSGRADAPAATAGAKSPKRDPLVR